MPGHLLSYNSSEAVNRLARMRADDRPLGDEAAFGAWSNADPGHAIAFEAANAVWESVGALPANHARMKFVCSRSRE